MSLMTQCRINYNILRVRAEEVKALKHYYENIFGLTYKKEKWIETRHNFFFKHQENPTGICFEESLSFQKSSKNQGYWKVGIVVEDVDAALDYIGCKSNQVLGKGFQFERIGYLTSITDPSGYSIELLQHTFQENFKHSLESEKSFLGQSMSLPALFGQITIRSKDQKKSCDFYSKVLGMKLVSIQPSDNYPFTLYFFAYTDLSPPKPNDLNAVENREWLWKQSFAQIEIQYRHGTESNPDFSYVTNDDQGHGMIGHVGYQIIVSKDQFQTIKSFFPSAKSFQINGLIIFDPDGYKIEVICCKDENL
jgi:Lactoylglutathione lyase and related lyases